MRWSPPEQNAQPPSFGGRPVAGEQHAADVRCSCGRGRARGTARRRCAGGTRCAPPAGRTRCARCRASTLRWYVMSVEVEAGHFHARQRGRTSLARRSTSMTDAVKVVHALSGGRSLSAVGPDRTRSQKLTASATLWTVPSRGLVRMRIVAAKVSSSSPTGSLPVRMSTIVLRARSWSGAPARAALMRTLTSGTITRAPWHHAWPSCCSGPR
jgi:hypothetical protein